MTRASSADAGVVVYYVAKAKEGGIIMEGLDMIGTIVNVVLDVLMTCFVVRVMCAVLHIAQRMDDLIAAQSRTHLRLDKLVRQICPSTGANGWE